MTGGDVQIEVKSKPIIFTAESMRAILEGRKTQTRRAVKPQPVLRRMNGCLLWSFQLSGVLIQDGPVGTSARRYNAKFAPHCSDDVLWCREPWAIEDPEKLNLAEHEGGSNPDWIYYRDTVHENTGLQWRSPLFMPRWASRCSIRITNVRLQRLLDITESDAVAEGCESVADYLHRWDSINGKAGMRAADNPWVWAYTFEVLQ